MTSNYQKFTKMIAIRLSALCFILPILLVPDFLEQDRLPLDAKLLINSKEVLDLAQAKARPENEWQSSDFATTNKIKLRSEWVRIRVPGQRSPNGDFVIEVAHPFLKKVDFFLADEQSTIKSLLTGTTRPESFQETIGPNFFFRFSAGEKERFVFIHTQNQEIPISYFSLRTQENFKHFELLRLLFLAGLLGCSLGIFLYNLTLYFTLKQSTYLFQAAIQFFNLFICYICSSFYKILTPWLLLDLELWSRIVILAACFLIITLTLFIPKFLGLKQNAYTSPLARGLLVAGCILLVGIMPFTSTRTSIYFPFIFGFLFYMWRNYLNTHSYHIPLINLSYIATTGGLATMTISLACIQGSLEITSLRLNMLNIGVIWMNNFFSIATALRLKQMEKRHDEILDVLTQDRPKTQLNNLLNPIYGGTFSSTQQEVSIMFVDIVSFSQISAGRPAKEIFAALSKRLLEIENIIEIRGGSIDRSLGDGVLCFFRFEGAGTSHQHALNAFQAACEIQELTVDDANRSEAERSSRLIMPVRIGIHSAKVMIGNLGTLERMDYTMIGSGVNFASRLEEACTPFKLIVSNSSLERLASSGLDRLAFSPISISVKHQDRLVVAYEFDPFQDDHERLLQAESHFLDQLGIAPRDQRFTVPLEHFIRFQTVYGDFNVLDYSRFGFRAEGLAMLGRKSILKVKVQTSKASVNQQLQIKKLTEFMVEVRWSRSSRGGSFEHGMKLFGGNVLQHEFIFDLMQKNFAGKIDSSPVSDIIETVA